MGARGRTAAREPRNSTLSGGDCRPNCRAPLSARFRRIALRGIAVGVWCVVLAFVTMKVLEKTLGLRAAPQTELRGIGLGVEEPASASVTPRVDDIPLDEAKLLALMGNAESSSETVTERNATPLGDSGAE